MTNKTTAAETYTDFSAEEWRDAVRYARSRLNSEIVQGIESPLHCEANDGERATYAALVAEAHRRGLARGHIPVNDWRPEINPNRFR